MTAEVQIEDSAVWKQRYRAPIVLWTQLAKAAPQRGLVCSNRTGTYQLHAWDVPCGTLRQLTEKPEGLTMASISPDGRYVYYIEDHGGDETGHYVRIPFSGGTPQDVTPNLPDYSSWSFEVSHDGSLLGFTAAMSDAFHTYLQTLNPDGCIGDPREIYSSRAIAFGPVLSHSGELAAVASSERSGKLQFSVLVFEVESGDRIGELWDGEESTVDPVAFAPLQGDMRLLATTDRSGTKRPLIWNPRTGERKDLDLSEVDGEVEDLDWSPDGTRVVFAVYHEAVQHLYVYDLQRDTLSRLAIPSGTCYANFASRDTLYARWQDSTHPARVVALDAHTGSMQETLLVAGEAPPARPWTSVSFPSSDGQTIQGWLAVPDGDGPFPTVLETHGGPEAVTTEVYSPRAQSWLDHGFAFLTINYRGSTTFGREFKEKIWYNPGYWEVEDMAAAYRWLVDSHITRPDAVFLTGWSYGGYLTLHGLGLKPELWAGGMAGVAVADWFSQYEDESDTMRGIDIPFFGGTPAEKEEAYRIASPITYAEQIRAPVVVIQGHNDTRCPPRQVALFEERLRSLGKPIEVHWFDAGHMVGPVEQAIEHQQIFLEFAHRVLG